MVVKICSSRNTKVQGSKDLVAGNSDVGKDWMLNPHASVASFLNKYGRISKQCENQKSEMSELLEMS